jgi:glycosyltransferase involved in cell wall biosynthesis
MIPEIVEHGVNGFMSNNEEELREYTQQLLDDAELSAKLGEEARKTIKEKLSEQNFIDNWNEIFDKAYGVNK